MSVLQWIKILGCYNKMWFISVQSNAGQLKGNKLVSYRLRCISKTPNILRMTLWFEHTYNDRFCTHLNFQLTDFKLGIYFAFKACPRSNLFLMEFVHQIHFSGTHFFKQKSLKQYKSRKTILVPTGTFPKVSG